MNNVKFEGTISLLTDEKAKELNISKASCLETAKAYYDEYREKKPLMPCDVWEDFEILPVVFNLAVVNKFNKNNEGINTDAAIGLARQFKNRPINVEHKKDLIVGHIINSSLGDKEPEYYEGDLYSFEGRKNTFFITAAGVIYKHLYPKLAEAIIEASNSGGDSYKSISTSWEVGFSEYKIFRGDNAYLEECEEVSAVDEYRPFIKQRGGKGKDKEGKNVYRLLTGEIHALGVALTTNPAADVSGIFTQSLFYKSDENAIEVDDQDGGDMEEEEDDESSASSKNENSKNNSSLSAKQSATLGNLLKNTNMDKTQFDSLIKTIEESIASKQETQPIHAILTEKLREFSDTWTSKVEAESLAREKAEQEFSDLKDQMKSIKADLDNARAQIEAQASAELLEARMAKLTKLYDLSEAELDIVGGDVAKIKDKTEFEGYLSKAAVLFSHKDKSKKKEEKREESTASVQEKEEKDEPKIEGEPEKSFANTNSGSAEGASAVAELVKNIKIKITGK